MKEATQKQADTFLGRYIKRYEEGVDGELPTWQEIERAFYDDRLKDRHIREMRFALFGVPVVARQTLSKEQWEWSVKLSTCVQAPMALR